MNTSEAVTVIVKALAPYVGETMARSATEAHCQKLGIAGAMSPDEREALLAKLSGALNIFLGRDKSASVVAEVRNALLALGGPR